MCLDEDIRRLSWAHLDNVCLDEVELIKKLSLDLNFACLDAELRRLSWAHLDHGVLR